MSNLSLDFSGNAFQPLAARMRPGNLTQYTGQQHLLAPDKPLQRAIGAEHPHLMILWGSPGTGKTTLAEVTARYASADIEWIPMMASGVKEIREAIEYTRQNRNASRRIILLADEVHRFNRSQQDTFLPHIEDGTIVFTGATIENPLSELNLTLLSRTRVYLLKSLTIDDTERVPDQVVNDKPHGHSGQDIILPNETRKAIAELADGNARRALNTLEMMTDMAESDDSGKRVLKVKLLTKIASKHSACFDNKGDRFYDLISILHKSVRGSAPGAALYWYAWIIATGGDPLCVARYCLAIASKDIGNADPRATQVIISAWDCFTRVGPTEDERAIAQTIVYLACVPRDNIVYTAFKVALSDVRDRPDYDAPTHLRNAPTKLMKEMGRGQEHYYAHDEPNAYAAGEQYFPQEMTQTRYCHPTNQELEGKISEKLIWFAEQDQNSPTKHYR